MRALFLVLVLLACLGGVIAVRLKHRIKNPAVRTTLLIIGALGLFAHAGDELYRITNGFSAWSALAGINVLVPLGWFMGGAFVLILIILSARNARSQESPQTEQSAGRMRSVRAWPLRSLRRKGR